MIKKITEKDKEDWENFLNNKKKNLNKNSIKKKDIKNPGKDKQDWENFLNNKEKISNKDFVHKKNIRHEKIKKIDFHGYTIEEANKAIEKFIQKCFDEDVTKIIVITGKGLRSKNVELEFSDDGIDAIANMASEVNNTVENIGARRLHTIIERILDDISFTATDRAGEKIIIDSKYVKQNLDELVKDTDLSKFIL